MAETTTDVAVRSAYRQFTPMVLTWIYFQEAWKASRLVPNAYLESVGVSATNYGAVCCTQCGVAYAPVGLRRHMNDIHKIKVSVTDFDAACEALGIQDDLPTPPSFELPAPAAGLNMRMGYWCGYCPKACGTEGSVDKHIRSVHKKGVAADRIYTRGYVQHFNNSTGRGIWRVAVPSDLPTISPTAEDAFTAKAHARLTDRPYAGISLDNIHNTNSWLRQTRWHVAVGKLDRDAVRSLVAPYNANTEPEWAIWMSAVDEWVREREELTSVVHVGIRKILHTEKPA